MLNHDAAIHDDENASGASFFGGFLVDHTFLHPDGRDFQRDRLVNNFGHELGTAKDINDVNFLGNIVEGCITFFAERAFNLRIHRDDAISLRLQVRCNSVARTHRAWRQSDDRDVARRLQDFADVFGF